MAKKRSYSETTIPVSNPAEAGNLRVHLQGSDSLDAPRPGLPAVGSVLPEIYGTFQKFLPKYLCSF